MISFGTSEQGTFERNNLEWQIQTWQRRLTEWLERLFDRDSTEPALPDWQLPDWVQKLVFWLVVVSAVVWAGWQLYQLFRPYFASYLRFSRGATSTAAGLPHSTDRSIAEWLDRSRTAQRQGDYREACRALYMATLQQLNDRELICQEPSRTDGEYLALLHPITASRPYQILIQTHEQLCFTDTPITPERFDQCWQAYQEIGRQAR